MKSIFMNQFSITHFFFCSVCSCDYCCCCCYFYIHNSPTKICIFILYALTFCTDEMMSMKRIIVRRYEKKNIFQFIFTSFMTLCSWLV